MINFPISLPAWLTSVLFGERKFTRGRSIGAGISSKLLSCHHEVGRRKRSKYPDAVSIAKTEDTKLKKRNAKLRREMIRERARLLGE
jgi:hypothetical protein